MVTVFAATSLHYAACHNSVSLPCQIRDEDVFKGLDNMVKNFLVSVPLVADLRSPAMRERHWQQLMEATKVRQNMLLAMLKQPPSCCQLAM
jgi:hypothetical protein